MIFNHKFGLLFILGITLFSNACAQNFDWVQAGYFNGPGQAGNSQINSISKAANSAVFVGSFENNISFDSKTLGSTGTDALLGRITVNNSVNLLQQSYSTTSTSKLGYAEAQASAVDEDGTIYVAYQINSATKFGTITTTTSGRALVIIKYSPDGSILWSKQFNSTLDALVGGITIDSNHNCLLAISFAGQITIDSRVFESATISSATLSSLLVSLSSSGNLSWANQLQGSGSVSLGGICADKNNSLYIAGHFDSTLALSATSSFSKSDLGHLFMAKYDAMGVLQWARQMGGKDLDVIKDIRYDSNSSVIICGSFGNVASGRGTSSAIFGNTTLHTTGNNGFADGFIAKYDTNGNYNWVKAFQGPAFEEGSKLATSEKGELYVAGSATAGSTFGVYSVTTGNGSADGFVAKYSPDGVEQWVVGFGGPFADYYAGSALAYDGQGHLYIGGSFLSGATFSGLFVTGLSGLYTAYIARMTDSQVLSSRPQQVNSENFSLFPNPTSGLVKLKWPDTVHPNELKVYTTLGKNIFSKKIGVREIDTEIDLTNFGSGMYIVSLYTNENTVLSKHVSIQ